MDRLSNPLRVFILFVVLLSMVGCVIAVNPDRWEDDDDDSWAERARHNSQEIDRLVVGASMDSVIASMGQPDIREAFVRAGTTYDAYYYRTHRVKSDYRTTKDEAVPLVFVGGKLVGWGESAIENALVTQN